MREENYYSQHVFFFPFKWNDGKDITSGKEKLALFEGTLSESSSRWKRNKDSYFPPKYLTQYNEVSYFYDFVWQALYDDAGPDSFLHHYSIVQEQPLFYSFKTKDKTYILDVDDILLHVYSSGAGVLSFHLYNTHIEQSDKEDILKINQFGRRLYPPFYGTQSGSIGTRKFDQDQDWAQGLAITKHLELADHITIANENQSIIIASDTFTRYRKPGQVPSLIAQLIGETVIERQSIEPVSDDRMFVLCWYGNGEMASLLKNEPAKKGYIQNSGSPQSGIFLEERDSGYAHVTDAGLSDWWYQYIFIDGGFRSCWDQYMHKNLIAEHTNSRWVGQGTLYGASRYSFVALTPPLSEFSLVAEHLRTMYYKMVELCLIQRISLLRFSDQVADISSLETEKDLPARVSHLYKEYIQFVNKIYFREITAQEQGIELYDLLSKHMRIERDVQNLDGEIHELHEYALLHEERSRTRSLQTLTILGAAFLVPTFVASFYGMNIFTNKSEHIQFSYLILLLFLTGAATVFFTRALLIKKSEILKYALLISAIILIALLLLWIPHMFFKVT